MTIGNAVLDLTDTVELHAQFAVAMSEDADEAQVAIARGRANAMVAVLSVVASMLALWDLGLLVRAGH